MKRITQETVNDELKIVLANQAVFAAVLKQLSRKRSK